MRERDPIRILDPALFVRKLAMLLIFSALFIPLKYYELETPLQIYIGVLVVMHVYFLFVLVWRVRWKVLAADRRSFVLRLVAVAFFVALLALLRAGPTFTEFLLFLGVSLLLHTGLLLAFNLVRAPRDAEPPAA